MGLKACRQGYSSREISAASQPIGFLVDLPFFSFSIYRKRQPVFLFLRHRSTLLISAHRRHRLDEKTQTITVFRIYDSC